MPAPQTAPDDSVPVTTVDNVFLPEDRSITECVGLVERPGCGSEQRGGELQFVLFGVLVAALAFIGWRIVRSARRRPQPPAPGPTTAL